MHIVVEMDKENYTFSEVIDFVTNGEESSNVDSDEEEEIVILRHINDENERLTHHMPRRFAVC